MEDDAQKIADLQEKGRGDGVENATPSIVVSASIVDQLNGIAKSVEKLMELYSMMTEYRDRSDLVLTQLTDISDRVFLIDDVTHDRTVERDAICRKTRALSEKVAKTMSSFGVVPIRPSRGDVFNPEQHLILGEVEPVGRSDHPGTICSCERTGYIRNGCVTPAEVVVFKKITQENTDVTASATNSTQSVSIETNQVNQNERPNE